MSESLFWLLGGSLALVLFCLVLLPLAARLIGKWYTVGKIEGIEHQARRRPDSREDWNDE